MSKGYPTAWPGTHQSSARISLDIDFTKVSHSILWISKFYRTDVITSYPSIYRKMEILDFINSEISYFKIYGISESIESRISIDRLSLKNGSPKIYKFWILIFSF